MYKTSPSGLILGHNMPKLAVVNKRKGTPEKKNRNL
jgi:hypothetical protein